MAKVAVKNIRFIYLDQSFFFPDRKELKLFLLQLFRTERYKVNKVTYNFCSDEYLAQLNEEHLNHNTLTYIITFQYSGNKEPILSEIFISIDRVKENARLYNCSFWLNYTKLCFTVRYTSAVMVIKRNKRYR